jgi:hypothetical protein
LQITNDGKIYKMERQKEKVAKPFLRGRFYDKGTIKGILFDVFVDYGDPKEWKSKKRKQIQQKE